MANSHQSLRGGISPPASSTRSGILSRTIFHSPEIKCIVPLQIRSQYLSDVAVVGERYVEIKNASENGRLHFVASKTDFGSRICAAHVVGSPQEWNINPGNMRTMIQKRMSSSTSRERHSRELPQQALLLTLESGHLLFLTLSRQRHAYEFRTSSITLPVLPVSSTSSPWTTDVAVDFVAVDPRSRAIATASRNGQIFFCGLEERAYLRESVTSHTTFSSPIRTDMTIVRIVFLFPTSGQADQVQLLVLGTDTEPRRLTMKFFTWTAGSSESLTSLHLTIPHEFIRDHDTPQILIPLEKTPGGFLLACDQSIAIYADTHLGKPNQIYMKPLEDFLPTAPKQRVPGSTLHHPLWKSWSRPFRHVDNEPEDIYLIREDGVLCYFEAHTASQTFTRAGELSGNVGDAFSEDGTITTLPDGLVFGGVHSDGGRFELGGRVMPNVPVRFSEDKTRKEVFKLRQTETLYNWAPFLDLAVGSSAPAPGKIFDHMPDRPLVLPPKIVGTSGRDPFGGISQLRYGYEAIVDSTVEAFDHTRDCSSEPLSLDDEAEGSVSLSFARLGQTTGSIGTRIWSISLGEDRWAALVSTPLDTQFVTDPCFNLSAQTWNGETLAAAKINSLQTDPIAQKHLVLWVTPQVIRVLCISVSQHLQVDDDTSLTIRPAAQRAAVDPSVRAAAVVANRKVMVARMGYFSGTLALSWLRGEQQLDADATCLSIFTPVAIGGSEGSDQVYIIVVATDQGDVRFVKVDSSENMSSIGAFNIASMSGTSSPQTCSSLAIVRDRRHPRQFLLLCGLRSGRLLSMLLSMSDMASEVAMLQAQTLHLGNSAVELVPCPHNADDSVDLDNLRELYHILICCDGHVIRFDFSYSLMSPSINYVWFVSLSKRSEQAPVTDLSCLSYKNNANEIPLLALSGEQILVARVGDQSKALPLRLDLNGTPNRVIFCQTFKCFFVASTVSKTYGEKRYWFSEIFVVNNDTNDYQKPAAAFRTEPGQQIRWLSEWNLEHKGKKYLHLVAATANEARDSKEAGNIIVLSIRRNGNTVEMTKLKSHANRDQINAICQFDGRTLLYCAGPYIKKLIYSSEDQKFVRLTRLLEDEAAGHGQFITAEKPFVHVSFGSGSTRVYRLDDDRLLPVVCENRARHGLSHLPLTDHDMLLATDKNKSVIGLSLSRINEANEGTSTPPIFEIKLPISISRMCRVNIRPPWKRDKPSRAIVERDLIGTAADGSAWMFSILRESTWRFLRFVQNMCLRREELGPLPTRAVMEEMHIEPRNTEAKDFQVDGDILGRLVDRDDAEQLLHEMLNAEPVTAPSTGAQVDFNTSARRRTRFVELLRESLEEAGAPVEDGGEEPIVRAIEVIRHIVETPF